MASLALVQYTSQQLGLCLATGVATLQSEITVYIKFKSEVYQEVDTHQGGEVKILQHFYYYYKYLGSSLAMVSKINGNSLADLVKLEVKKMVDTQLDEMHVLLMGALARIKCLEKEITDYKADWSVP